MTISKDEYNRREELMKTIKEVASNSEDINFTIFSTFVAVDQYIDSRHKSYEEAIRHQLNQLVNNNQSIDVTLKNIMDIINENHENHDSE